ncbi:hypothetical protein AB0L06_00725 [Spirillospora sp. NPDC052269]
MVGIVLLGVITLVIFRSVTSDDKKDSTAANLPSICGRISDAELNRLIGPHGPALQNSTPSTSRCEWRPSPNDEITFLSIEVQHPGDVKAQDGPRRATERYDSLLGGWHPETAQELPGVGNRASLTSSNSKRNPGARIVATKGEYVALVWYQKKGATPEPPTSTVQRITETLLAGLP